MADKAGWIKKAAGRQWWPAAGRQLRGSLVAGLFGLGLAGCGGGGDAANPTAPADSGAGGADPVEIQVVTGASRAEAFRLLTQASFGPTEADLQRVTSLGLSGWVDEQLAKPARAVHWARWQADNTAARQIDPRATAGAASVVSSFYQQALQADDQLRQRMAFALSEILVVSLTDLNGYRAESVAAWQDMLTRHALGNFRNLLEDVSQHPAMGQYLSILGSRKEDLASGRIADQNYARELMQLFSIGLVQLNLDGSPRLDSRGLPIETYGADDIVGLSRVFTGYSWATLTPGAPNPAGLIRSPQRMGVPMQSFAQLHSTSEKRFLGAAIAAQPAADAAASRRAALDTLFRHPNVGPFIGRQLIQRLVTSNPSPAYVARVAAVFNNNGQGVRGDLKAVARAVLLDDEARNASTAAMPAFGKLREPVLRLTALLRAYSARSLTGPVQMTADSDPGFSIGQAPLSAPSVFNFFRPGHQPTGGPAETAGLALPEMQTTDEISVAGYANAMTRVLTEGAGKTVLIGTSRRPDLQLNLATDQALAADPAALVERVGTRLLTTTPSPAFKAELVAAVGSIPIPALLANGSNAAKVEAAKLNRLRAALLLTLVSPEFLVQK